MKQLVKELITQPEIDKIADLLTQAIAVATPPAIPLDMADRQKRRKMGTARQGYVNMVLPVAINNIGLLRRDQEPAYLGKLMDTFTKIATMRGLAQKMLELADDTWMGIGIDAVALADSMVNSLQDARKNNDSLDTEMAEIDEYNSRFGPQMQAEDVQPAPVTPTPAPPLS